MTYLSFPILTWFLTKFLALPFFGWRAITRRIEYGV